MDFELLNEARSAIAGIDGVMELEKTDASDVITSVAERYMIDRSKVWWWQGMANESTTIEYGDDYSWPLIQHMVLNEEQLVYLVITDDDPEPWPVFKGTFSNIGKLIAELWRFEYFLTDKDFSWVIFDTHHNSLIVSGTLEQGRENKEWVKGSKPF